MNHYQISASSLLFKTTETGWVVQTAEGVYAASELNLELLHELKTALMADPTLANMAKDIEEVIRNKTALEEKLLTIMRKQNVFSEKNKAQHNTTTYGLNI